MTPGGLDALAAATPATRDRYVDFLRAASILVVVLGHWTIAVIAWDGGVIRSTSVIGLGSGLWMATWVCQVMPVFFFVGGYANLVGYTSARRQGATPGAFVRARLRRLLIPFAALLGTWTIVEVVLHLFRLGSPTGPRIGSEFALLRGVRPPGQTIPFGPLWFLAVYLFVVALSPLTVTLHRRFGGWVVAVMAAGAVVCDAVGFIGQQRGIRYFNVLFVLLLPHQLGHFYGDGSALRWPRRRLGAMVAGGIGGLVALTNPWLFRPFGEARFRWFPGIGHYPRSLLGTDTERVSNAYPPTLCYLLVGLGLIGAALLARPVLVRWLERPRVWKATIAVNASIMTLFLWHMTAYLVAILALWPVGLGHERRPSLRWWLERPLWLAVPAAVLAGMVAVFARFEARGRRSVPGRRDPITG